MLKKTLILLTIVSLLAMALPAYAMEQTLTIGPFAAQSLNGEGEEVTEDVFAEADITLLNFWATWCGPCIAELPDLAQISEETGGKVQVIGVQIDAITELGVPDESAVDAMELLVEDAGVEYAMLQPDEFLFTMSSMFQAIPTTIIIDRDGNMLDMAVGSNDLEGWLTIAQAAGVQAYGKDFTLQ